MLVPRVGDRTDQAELVAEFDEPAPGRPVERPVAGVARAEVVEVWAERVAFVVVLYDHLEARELGEHRVRGARRHLRALGERRQREQLAGAAQDAQCREAPGQRAGHENEDSRNPKSDSTGSRLRRTRSRAAAGGGGLPLRVDRRGQDVLLHLARRGRRQRVEQLEPLGQLVGGEAAVRGGAPRWSSKVSVGAAVGARRRRSRARRAAASGRPTTAARSTSGKRDEQLLDLAGAMLSPPRMMISFLRPTIVR